MFPDRTTTDRLRFERFGAETVEPRALYEHVSTRNPTTDAETVPSPERGRQRRRYRPARRRLEQQRAERERLE